MYIQNQEVGYLVRRYGMVGREVWHVQSRGELGGLALWVRIFGIYNHKVGKQLCPKPRHFLPTPTPVTQCPNMTTQWLNIT